MCTDPLPSVKIGEEFIPFRKMKKKNSTLVKWHFYSLKSLFLRKQRQNLGLFYRKVGTKDIRKNANFSTLVKWHFNSLNSLLLRKQHHQTTKPRSLLQKRRRESCMKFLFRIMVSPIWKYANFSAIVKWHLYRLKGLFWENNIIRRLNQVLFYRKVGSKDFGIFDQNHCLPLWN